MKVVHLFKLHYEIFLVAQLHQNKRAYLQPVFQFDHLVLVVFFALLEETPDDTITLLCWSKHTHFVAEPEKLDRTLNIARQLIKHVIVGL